MVKFAIASCVVALACVAGGVSAGPTTAVDGEVALRQSMQQAMWPADIARLSGDYLKLYPRGSAVETARALHVRANETVRVLSHNDVRLYKNAFMPGAVPQEVSVEIRKAALGDQAAAIRLAHQYRLTDRSPRGISRYVGWLQFAATLGSEEAAYELAVYFRQSDQPALAAQYEARAVALGYKLPTVLDHIRK